MLSDDQIRFVGGLLLSIPFSWGIRMVPTYQLRLAYSFGLGLLLQFVVYGYDIWMSMVLHLGVYILMMLWGRKCGAVVTLTTVCLISIYHMYRMIIDYGSWTLDVSTIFMSMICKYSMLAYSYEEGTKSIEEIGQNHYVHRVVELPKLIDYLGYCVFLPTCIIGTTTQYTDYNNLMHMKPPFNNISGRLILRQIFFDIGYAVVCVLVYLFGDIYFSLSSMKSDNFAQKGALYIVYYSFCCVTFLRFKYYFGWKLSDCSLHACGISYQGDSGDKKDKFTRVQTCDPYLVQTNSNFKVKITYWNMSCQLWLRRCIYENLFKGKPYAQGATFMFSAIWHGFYGGYYFSFFFWFLQIHLNKLIFRYWKYSNSFIVQITERSFIWRVISWIFWLVMFTNNGIYFQILEIGKCIAILKAIYGVPPLIILVAITYFTINSPKNPKNPVKND